MLVSIRGFEPDKCDIFYKYTEDEARKLKSFKEIPENGKTSVTMWIVKIEATESEESDEESNVMFIQEGKEEEEKADTGKGKDGKSAEAEADLEDL